jgi:aminoglycoside phosphotransferase (APT) family kinase protein
VGDPACDLAISWTFFDAESRKVFRDKLNLDNNTWIRGLAWTLWKALIIAAGIVETNAIENKKIFEIIDTVLKEYKFYK